MDDRTTEELVSELERNPEWPPAELLDAIAARGIEAIAPLTDLVERRVASGDDDAALYYAAMLLGALRDPDAMPGLIRLFGYWDDEDLEMASEGLGAVGAPAIGAALAILDDESRTPFQRAMGSRSAVIAAGDRPDLREWVARRLREKLADYIARSGSLTIDDADVATAIVSDLSDLRDPQARPLIEAAFAAEIVDDSMICQEDVESIYRGEMGGPDRVPDHLTEYREKREEWIEQERRAEEHSRARQSEPTSRRTMDLWPAVNPHRSLGRNDPCWCGSGRKYKQCHLEADLRSRT